MKIISIIVMLTSYWVIHKNLSFLGFLQINQFDKEDTVGMDVSEFPDKIDFCSFNDGIESYVKCYFKNKCNEVLANKLKGKNCIVISLLSEAEKMKIYYCKKHLYLNFF